MHKKVYEKRLVDLQIDLKKLSALVGDTNNDNGNNGKDSNLSC